jgi:hypothetical protein
MLNDFSVEYARQSDDELLDLASHRHSLLAEASAALDAELRRRKLTESDRLEHKRFVRRQENRESRQHRRKPIEPLKYRMSWRDLLWALGAIALICVVYFALPSRYHMRMEWQEAGFIVMMTTILLVFATRQVFWRNATFWISIAISSVLHLAIVHAWTRRTGDLSRSGGKVAAFLGLALFLAVYWIVRLLRRVFGTEETVEGRAQGGHVIG